MVETKTSSMEESLSTASRVFTTLTSGKASRAADLVSVAERSKTVVRLKCSGRALMKGMWKTANRSVGWSARGEKCGGRGGRKW